MTNEILPESTQGLVDFLDQLLSSGVLLDGNVRLGLAGIELVHLDLRALLIGTQALHSRTGSSPSDAATTVPPPAPARRDWDSPPLEAVVDGQRGITGLLLVVAELVRRLLEGQALERLTAGSLTDVQAERLGNALRELDKGMHEIRERLGRLAGNGLTSQATRVGGLA